MSQQPQPQLVTFGGDAIERSIGCEFVSIHPLPPPPSSSNQQPNVNNSPPSTNSRFYCKTMDGDSVFIMKSSTEILTADLAVVANNNDLILKLEEHIHCSENHYYYHKSKNSCKMYSDFLDQMQGQSFSSTEWTFAKLLNEKDILTLCWQIIYLFSSRPELVTRETMIIEIVEDGSVKLRAFPTGCSNNGNERTATTKIVLERLAVFILELVSIYLDLPCIPPPHDDDTSGNSDHQHDQEIGQAIDLIENLPSNYSNNSLLIQCIVPTLKTCISTTTSSEIPDLYELFTLFLLQSVNLDSTLYWTTLSSLPSNIHKRTVADIWIEGQKLLEHKQLDKAMNATFEITNFSFHPFIPFLTGQIYYEQYRKTFYQLHFPGDVTLLSCAAHYFTEASKLSKQQCVEYLEKKVECNLRRWILDNELDLDKSNTTMNELSAEIDHLIELNPKSSSLYSMKSTLYLIYYLRFRIIADMSHISIILTFAEVARSNSPTNTLYQLFFEFINSMFSDSSNLNIESTTLDEDPKFLLIMALILDINEKDYEPLTQKLKKTDYRKAILDALWLFPMLTEEMTLRVTGNIIIARTNDKYKAIVGKLNHKYVKDDETKVCMKCQTKFTLVTRRHHCRFCGRIFCNLCSSKKIRYQKEEEKRSCDQCFNFLSLEFAALCKSPSNNDSTTTNNNNGKDVPNNTLSIECQQFFQDQIQLVCSQSLSQSISQSLK